ncbi:hypothetical protein STEG23_002767 [Scotinomys teguina]
MVLAHWMSTCKRLEIDPYLSPCTKLKSKWIKALNLNPITLNVIEEKTEPDKFSLPIVDINIGIALVPNTKHSEVPRLQDSFFVQYSSGISIIFPTSKADSVMIVSNTIITIIIMIIIIIIMIIIITIISMKSKPI